MSTKLRVSIDLGLLKNQIESYRGFIQDNYNTNSNKIIRRAESLHEGILSHWERCTRTIDTFLKNNSSKEDKRWLKDQINKYYLPIVDSGLFVKMAEDMKAKYLNMDQRSGADALNKIRLWKVTERRLRIKSFLKEHNLNNTKEALNYLVRDEAIKKSISLKSYLANMFNCGERTIEIDIKNIYSEIR